MTDEVVTPYTLKLAGPGIALDKQLNEAAALAVVQIAMGGIAAAPALAPGAALLGGQSARLAPVGQKVSLRENMEDSGAKGYSQKIVVTGRFLRDFEGQANFSRDDVRDRFRSAGEPPASNLPRDFTVAVQAGWIAEDHQNRGQYYITRKGDEAAERRFEGATPSTKARRRRKNSSAEKVVSPHTTASTAAGAQRQPT